MNKKPLFFKNHNSWPKWLRKPGLVLLTTAIVLPGLNALGASVADNATHTIQQTNQQSSTQIVKGTIKDNADSPLPGATVSIKGKTVGTITDIDGKYQLNVSEGDVLVYNFIGMQPQEVVFRDRKRSTLP